MANFGIGCFGIKPHKNKNINTSKIIKERNKIYTNTYNSNLCMNW